MLVKPRTQDVDDCFADPLVDPAVQFGAGGTAGPRVTLHSNCSHWVVFDGRDHGICIEPQSGPPNGVNEGLGDPIGWALPGQPLTLDTAWRITGAPQRG